MASNVGLMDLITESHPTTAYTQRHLSVGQ